MIEPRVTKPAALAANIHSIHAGMPRTVVDGRTAEGWTTGFFKGPILGPVRVGLLNLDGDGQADLVNHGGPDKAINSYPIEHYPVWSLMEGLPELTPGAFGENLTTEGILESDVCIGDVFTIGDVVVQISQPRQPCWKLSRRWKLRDLALRVQESGRTGWYFRVLKEGIIGAGARMVLAERHYPEWTVSVANEVMHHRTDDMEAARRLMSCHLLTVRWRDTLRKRVETGSVSSSKARLYGPD